MLMRVNIVAVPVSVREKVSRAHTALEFEEVLKRVIRGTRKSIIANKKHPRRYVYSTPYMSAIVG